MQATGVPMAVPMVWSQEVSPNWKTLVVMTRVRRSIMSGGWKSPTRWLDELQSDWKVERYLAMVEIPSELWMLVYIDSASQVQINVLGGKVPSC